MEASDGEGVVDTIELPQLQISQQYIDLLQSAALDKLGMQPEEIDKLRNPDQNYMLADPLPLLCLIHHHFVNNSSAS